VLGFVDSGVTSHMSGDIFLFLSLSPLPINKDSVNIADGTLFHTVGLCLHPGFYMIDYMFLS
jgi:hypothetical protein